MAMNKYMHPRNIYKTPPNFKQLAIEFPEFRNHVKQDISGKIILDFKDLEALRSLSCTLLKKDFNLNVEIPSNKLIPTIPLRLNYLLWIEDLLSITDKRTNIKGIDIGTGASCVYPLIAAKKFGWSMIGTEIDNESFICARTNVQNNSLNNLITVLNITSDTLLEEIMNTFPDEEFDFCMCNPPFFSSPQELHPFFKSRTAGRSHPRNAFCATTNEVVSDGGEVEFITKLINESKNLQNKIRIYSTMLGHKSSLPPLKKLLREINVTSFKESEFCQGRTTRWGLAWNFSNIDLRKIPPTIIPKKSKIKAPLKYFISEEDMEFHTVENYSKKLLEMFEKLLICYETFKDTKNIKSYLITAYTNTWSHQRRKKRAEKKLNSIIQMEDGSPSTSDEACNTSNESTELDDICKKSKREYEDEETLELQKLKKIKIEDCNSNSKFHLKGLISIKYENNGISIELNSVEDTTDRESLHQILQYLKNNLK